MKEKTLKVQIEVALKERLDHFLVVKRISLTDMISSTIDWLLKQDSTLQSIVLQQLNDKDAADVLPLIANRLQNKAKFDAIVSEDTSGTKTSGGRSKALSGASKSH